MAFVNGVWQPEAPSVAEPLPPGLAAPTPGVPVVSPGAGLGAAPIVPLPATPLINPGTQLPPQPDTATWQDGAVAPPNALQDAGTPGTVPAPPPVPAPGMVQAGTAPAGAPGGGGLRVPDSSEAALAQAGQGVQQALVDQGQAQFQAGQDEANARGQGLEQEQAQQAQIRAAQVQRDAAVREINDQQARALEEAHAATIPDFWEGREGAHVGAAISMALGEAGRGLQAFGAGVNVGNTAKDIIDRSVSQYMQRKQEEISNLFRYAQMRNQLSQEQKQDWANKLNDLRFDAAALHQNVADHILQVAAASKGRVNQAEAMTQAKQQALQSQQLIDQARKTAFDMQVRKRELGLQGYNAETERIKAEELKQSNLQMKQDKVIDDDMKLFEKSIAKPREQLAGIDDLLTQMDSAYASRDPDKLAALTVALKEQVGPLFAGGKTTGNLTKQLDAMGTTKDQIQKAYGKLTGGNTVGDTLYKRLRELMVFGADEKKNYIGQRRQAHVNKYEGPGGSADTADKKRKFENDLKGITSTITFGGQPLFQEGGAPSPSAGNVAAPATGAVTPPAGATNTGRTAGGKPVFRDSSGRLFTL